MTLIVERYLRRNLACITWNQQNTPCLWHTVWIQSKGRDDFRSPDCWLSNILTFCHEECAVTVTLKKPFCTTECNNTALWESFVSFSLMKMCKTWSTGHWLFIISVRGGIFCSTGVEMTEQLMSSRMGVVREHYCLKIVSKQNVVGG